MHKMMHRIFLMMAATLLLSGCGMAQEKAADKMAAACRAGIAHMKDDEPFKATKTTHRDFTSTKGIDYHMVDVTVEIEGRMQWAVEETYKCAFTINTGIFGIGYSAEFAYVDVDGEILGEKDGKTYGDYEENLKLAGAMAPHLD